MPLIPSIALLALVLQSPAKATGPEKIESLSQLATAAGSSDDVKSPGSSLATLVAKKIEPDNPWSRVRRPAYGPPEVIGSYDAGCIRGAERLPVEPGYEIMRPKRRRFYGHPDMIQFIETLGRQARSEGFGDVLIGDVGQPRGGPSLSGHASHQTGLDVDVWLWQPPIGRTLTERERDSLSAPKMVVDDFERLTKNWSPRMMEVLRLAAESPRVERIFVNPVIKREVCAAYKGRPWVQKLRPWWDHNDHFHVRLSCPDHNSSCKAQEPTPSGDGCDASLEYWFTPERKAEARYKREHPEPSAMPTLPTGCEQVLRSEPPLQESLRNLSGRTEAPSRRTQ